MKHNIEPVYNEKSKILILGSFPSVMSREEAFFYAHPQNRFWRVLSSVLGLPAPLTVSEKKELLLNSNIALWDVISECDLTGSSDASIKNAKPNDISVITDKADIKAVYLNGKLSYNLFEKYIKTDIPYYYLPSTSPANAAYSYDKLVCAWSVICKAL